ncbi:MAG: hypothetical protein IT289_10570 [Oligoflexia bacterium]|nr:hypothetical protein [Oligoflexia bacterium]
MSKLTFRLIALSLVAVGQMALAAEEATLKTSASEISNRQKNKIGAYLSLLGDPAPTLAGLNAAYNVTDYLRLHAGYGEVKVTTSVSMNGNTLGSSEASMTTLGLGALTTVPNWSLTPVAGVSYSRVFTSGDGEFNVNQNNVYGTVGLDWQSEGGFNVGLGYNMAFTAKGFSNGYINLGYFFM